MNDVPRHDLQHHGRALREQRSGVRGRLLGVRRRERRHHRNVISIEQPLDFDRIEPLATIGQCRGDDLPGGLDIGHKGARHRRRNLRQRLHHLPVLHQMHEAPYRIVLRGVVGNSCAAQEITDLLVRADPHGEQWLG